MGVYVWRCVALCCIVRSCVQCWIIEVLCVCAVVYICIFIGACMVEYVCLCVVELCVCVSMFE